MKIVTISKMLSMGLWQTIESSLRSIQLKEIANNVLHIWFDSKFWKNSSPTLNQIYAEYFPITVTTFVAEDGQGGHIIISGGPEYQDNSVVAISGQQVSTVAEGQLMTIASGENAPVSIAGSTYHVCLYHKWSIRDLTFYCYNS